MTTVNGMPIGEYLDRQAQIHADVKQLLNWLCGDTPMEHLEEEVARWANGPDANEEWIANIQFHAGQIRDRWREFQ